ncbi:MAG: hypothetical protein ACOX6T_24965, partial [Myxococcales bacterium]
AALLNLEPRKAALPFVFGASFAAAIGSLSSAVLAIDNGEPASPTLAIAAAAFFFLVRFNGSPWWLAFASALGACAIGFALPPSALPLMLVLVAHAHFGFVLLERRAPGFARAVFGVERPGFALGILAHLHAAAAVLAAAIVIELGVVESPAIASPAAALFAFYALAPRVDRRAGWLGAALVAGGAALALSNDVRHALLLLALCGVAGAVLGALARRHPRAAERCVLASLPAVSHVLTGTGLALAVTAGLCVLGDRPAGEHHGPLVLGCVSLAFFLAPRSFPSASLLVPAAVAAVLAVAGALPELPRALLVALSAVALTALGALARAAPGATHRLVACEPMAAAKALTGTGLAAALLVTLAMPFSDDLAPCAALVGLAFALSPQVFPMPLLLGPAAAFALLAAGAGSSSAHRALAVALGAFAVAACAALLRRFPRVGRLLFGLGDEKAPLSAQTLAVTALGAAAVAIALRLALPSGAPLALIVGLAAAIASLAFASTGWRALIPVAAATFVVSLAVAPERLETSFLAALAGINLLFWLAGPSRCSRFDALLSFVRRLGFLVGQDAEPSAESRARALLLGTAVTGAALTLGLLSALSLGRWVAFALGLAPALTAAMVAAQALTAWHQLRRRPSILSWHMALILLAVGLWMLGGREASPYLAGTAAVALAIFEAALARETGPRLIRRLGIELEPGVGRALAKALPPYLVALASLGVASTGLRPALLAAPVSLGLAAVAFAIRAAGGSRWSRHALAALVPLALHFALFHAGIRLSTGRPPATILPFLALAMTLAALGVETLARRLASGPAHRYASCVALAYAALAAGEWIAGLALARFEGGELAASTLAILGLTWFCVRRAQATGSRLLAHAGFAAFVALYLSLRVQTGLFGTAAGRSDADTLAGLVFGFLFLGVHAAVKRLGLQTLSEPARRFALLMPIAGALLLEPEPTLSGALLLFGIAAQLTALSAVENRGKVSGVLAAVAFNLALAMLWLRSGIGGVRDAQLYVIPAGATLIVLAHVFRQGLGSLWQSRLRAVGVLGIYVSSVYPALTAFDHPSYALWCALLCVVGVAVGITLRVRVYLYLGTAFLVTCVLGNMIRFGLQHHQVGAAFLTALGLLVVGFMIFFSARREELLRKYRKIEALLAEWQ